MEKIEGSAVVTQVLKNSAVLTVKQISGALELLADGIDEITAMGENHLDGRAALGFANIIHSCARDLKELIVTANYEIESVRLKKPASAKKGQKEEMKK